MWETLPCSTVLPPGKRLEKGDTVILPDKIFHLRYRGIVGSLGYLVNMTRPDLAFESRKIQKGPPIGRESVSKENSDFLGEKTNRKSEKT